jgi:hypothetical protein
MKMLSLKRQTQIAEALKHIASADRQTLILLWQELIGTLPPKNLSLTIMRKALAFETQVKAYGDASKRLAKHFNKACDNKYKAAPLLKPGARLVREWNGKTWHVEVMERGFVMNGKTYKSLSAIAREITDAQWSGPRFFGLTSTQQEPMRKVA